MGVNVQYGTQYRNQNEFDQSFQQPMIDMIEIEMVK
jgi:hypothetical protein